MLELVMLRVSGPENRPADQTLSGSRENTMRSSAMAETSKGKKFIRIQGYVRADGTKVHTHDRSTPTTSHGASRTPRRGRR
jgi:hypothetical protein